MKVKSNTESKWLKRILMGFIAIVAVFAITGCTKAFTTTQDNSEKLFSYYGNIYEKTKLIDENYTDDYDYASGSNEENRKKLIKHQNTNRTTLFSTLTPANGLTTWFELVDENNNYIYLDFMNNKVDEFVNTNVKYWMNGDIEDLKDEKQAKSICKHVAIYAGLEFNDSKPKVSSLWKNMNDWHTEAQKTIGILNCPATGFINQLQTSAKTAYSSNTVGISPVDMTITQDGAKVYVEGKTWGQAFKEYGFLEGLLVYPMSCLVHYIIQGLGGSGWAAIFAIFILTLIVRSLTVVSTLLQSKSQAKQNKIQPLLNELQKKYPDSETDKQQRQQMAMEQAQIMKQAKMHPFLPLLFMLLQFPLFICVWSALQGNVALAGTTWLGLPLTTLVSSCFTQAATTEGAATGIVIFIVMSIANILSTMTSMWFQNWRTKNFNPQAAQPSKDGKDPTKMTKMMSYVMMIFVLIMGFSLPTGMGIYWFIGALISILQTLLTELLQTKARHKNDTLLGGTNTTLAQTRRSARHQEDSSSKDNKKSKSDKPMWR